MHVHGVGVNPAEGAVMLASHAGMFRVDADGDVLRVADDYRDVMAFTVVGADHFLGSGHPDVAGLRSGEPGHVGLIESTDGGRSWHHRSLGGEADLHALVAAHDQVFGWDSITGTFMVSDDLQRWERRSRLELTSFGVDPIDPQRILAATPSGVVRSSDGGRSWAPEAEIALAAMSWTPDSGAWGVDADGRVWSREPSGWATTGRLPGPAQAVGAHETTLFAVVETANGGTRVLRSVDAGRSWTQLADDSGV